MVKVFTDGGSRGNPGMSACAFVVYEDDKEIYSESKFLGTQTNNFAEYSAVLLALNSPFTLHHSPFTFYLDSELVVKQLTGLYKIKNPQLQVLALQIKKIILENKLNITFQNVPREKNKRADELVNKELDLDHS